MGVMAGSEVVERQGNLDDGSAVDVQTDVRAMGVGRGTRFGYSVESATSRKVEGYTS